MLNSRKEHMLGCTRVTCGAKRFLVNICSVLKQHVLQVLITKLQACDHTHSLIYLVQNIMELLLMYFVNLGSNDQTAPESKLLTIVTGIHTLHDNEYRVLLLELCKITDFFFCFSVQLLWWTQNAQPKYEQQSWPRFALSPFFCCRTLSKHEWLPAIRCPHLSPHTCDSFCRFRLLSYSYLEKNWDFFKHFRVFVLCKRYLMLLLSHGKIHQIATVLNALVVNTSLSSI